MINKYIFLILALVVAIILFGFILEVCRKRNKSNYYILNAMICGFIEMLIYCSVLLSVNKSYCYVAFTFTYILTEWLAFYFLRFIQIYADVKRKYNKLFRIFSIVNIVDTVCLIANIFPKFLFTISIVRSAYDYSAFYWAVKFNPFIAVHFAISYAYVFGGIAHLIRYTVDVSSFYKLRFAGILIAYSVVIVVRVICLLARLHMDYSILLYGVMGAFVSYYITYSAPHQLIYQVLRCYNISAEDAMLFYDEKGTLLLANNAAKKLFIRDGVFSEDAANDYCQTVINRYVKIRTEKTYFKDSFVVNSNIVDISGEFQEFFDRNNLLGSFMYLQNVTEEDNRLKKQQFLANNDSVTGIYNREYFFETADKIIQKDPYTPRLMLCSNIIDFKLINEILGTGFGDAVLRQQADLIRRLSRADDIYCRISDDKFAILTRKSLFDPEVYKEGIKVVQKMTESKSFQLKIKIGIYEIQGDRETARVIYDKAYMAIDKSDDSEDRLFYYYDVSFMEKLMEERNMISSFDEELKHGNFRLFLTPIMNKNKEIAGMEAGSKWMNMEKGLLDSSVYTSVFEKNGIVYKLDKYIWEEAIKTVAVWNKNHQKDYKLVIQVSVKDSYYIDIYETLVSLVTKYDFKPENLIVGFLEKSISVDFSEVNQMFAKMQNYGFKILVNRFGNGQSSLNLLKDTHLDCVKIDGKFISESSSNAKNQKILEFMISLSRMLGLFTYTEGITSRQQFERLKTLELDGFLGDYCGSSYESDLFEQEYL